MSKELTTRIQEKNIRFLPYVEDWKVAIKEVAQPLLIADIIEERYIEAMIDNVLTLGNYIILVPNVAMPHARPELGAKKTGVSFLKLEKPVSFGGEKTAQLLICLATKNNEEHLSLLQDISVLIDEEEKVDRLINSKEPKDFYLLIKEYVKKANEEEE